MMNILKEILQFIIEQLFAFGERKSFRDDFKKGIPLKTPFNQGPKYGGASISLDNKEMYICACTKNGGYFNCDIYLSKKELKTITLKKEGIEYIIILQIGQLWKI